MQRNIAFITRHYLVAALWSSTDEHGAPLDAVFTVDDVSPELLKESTEDVRDFVEANAALLDSSGLSDEQIGHYFWLTRHGHGAGFWDRGLGVVGEALSEACKPYGEVCLYAGDDGWVYA
jgi:hypothetical protein